MSKYEKLDSLAASLKQMRPLNQTEWKRLRDEFIIEHTHDSTAIEGNTLTLRETALILQEGVTIAEKPLKDHLEAIGYKKMPLNTLYRLQRLIRRLQRWLLKISIRLY